MTESPSIMSFKAQIRNCLRMKGLTGNGKNINIGLRMRERSNFVRA